MQDNPIKDKQEEDTTGTLLALKGVLEALQPKEEDFIIKALKQLGTLLTSTAVLAIIGKALGVSDIQLAILSIFALSSLYVIIYRNAIERVLRSYMLILLILMVSAALLIYKDHVGSLNFNESFTKSTGIVEFSPRANDFLPRLGYYMSNSHEEIWLTGMSFYITLPQHKDLILKKLHEGVDVRFLVYNPLSPNLEEVANGYSQTKEELFSECEVTIQNLRSILNEWKQPKSSAKFEVRLFSSIPQTRIYVFDRRRETGFTYFIPHVDRQNSPNLPGFLVKNVKTGIAQPYFEGIERLWNNSTQFEDWLKTYDAQKQRLVQSDVNN